MDIVIVDDHDIYRQTLARIVTSIFSHCRINEFDTGEKFLEIIEKGLQVDLVLMDIKLPGLDGVETTKQALKLKPDLLVLGISIKNDSDTIIEMKKAGAKGFLLKGGDKKGIKEAIECVLNSEMFFEHID